MKKMGFALALLLIISNTFAQDALPRGATTLKVSDPEGEKKLGLAISSDVYPVTPGDTYHLVFQQGDVQMVTDILVESDYSLNLNVFGKMNVAGMTFAQLKPKVERSISNSYPRSMPSLTISSIGIFQILLKGETPQSQNVVAWGLSRLNEIVEAGRSPLSSIRDVLLISRNGTQRRFDIFKAYRLGLTEENPYMRPGDVVVLSRAERTVEVAGEIRFPGKYQLLPGDQLPALLELYGAGLTNNSDRSRVRIDTVSGEIARTYYADIRGGYPEGISLSDGDVVFIPAKTSALPIVFFEGAVLTDRQAPAAANQTMETVSPTTPIPYNRLIYSFKEGEMLSDAITGIQKSISPVSNLGGSFVIRQGVEGPIPVDLQELLGGALRAGDMPLHPFDRIVIPAIQFYVSVYGEVSRPGSYPYAPQKTYQYYVDIAGPGVENIPENIIVLDTQGDTKDSQGFIQPQDRIYVTASFISVQGAVFSPGRFPYRKNLPPAYYVSLAGGVDPDKSAKGTLTVFDVHGKARTASEGLQPGDQVYVHTDSAAYGFNKNFPIVSSVISFLATILTLVATVIALSR
jgi:polysaccharide biosynthesis/export protein